jgi:lysophospholipase L1-like esterase
MSRKDLALSAASFAVGLILVEIALRLLHWSFPVFVQPDAALGWSFRPGISGWSSHEATAYIAINRFGFRGRDWSERPPRDAYRVAVIGDSFIDGSNLNEERIITTQIERNLEACPARTKRTEILNFGISGYGTAQEYLLLQDRVEPFRPDMILLAFYVGNDVANNSRTLSIESQKAKPYFIEQPSGELRLDTSFRDSDDFRASLSSEWQKRLVNASALLQALKQLQQGKPVMPPLEEDRTVYRSAQGLTLFEPEYPELFSSSENETWTRAWSATEKLILNVRNWARERHTDFGLVIIPVPVQVLPGEDARRAAVEKFGLTDLDHPVNRLELFAKRNEISYLSLLDSLRSYGDRERVFLYGFPPRLGDGHLNRLGNQVSGETIASWLCERPQPQSR